MFTFKQGTDFLPAGNTPLFGVLAKWGLQQKQGDATGNKEEYIRDEEHTYGKNSTTYFVGLTL